MLGASQVTEFGEALLSPESKTKTIANENIFS